MKISVIISCHKASPYLDEAIKSVKSQSFDDYEILLSSDGWEGVAEYAERYEIPCVISPKGNNCTALNNAVKLCAGEWVKEVHYDDMLMPDALTNLYDFRGGALVYGLGYNFKDNDYYTLIQVNPVITWDTLYPPFKAGMHGAAFMFRRDVFLEVGGYDENMTRSEEYEFYLRLLNAGYQFNYCPKIIALYRRHGDQKTATYKGEIREKTINYIIEKYGKKQ